MDIFISWSGDRGKEIAKALYDWLPCVINAVKPWMSETDIEGGARWAKAIADRLANTKIGVICLTPENLNAPWILFEAGALSKTLDDDTRVIPYIVDLQKTDITGPLAQFQAKSADQSDTKSLVQTINKAMGTDRIRDEVLNKAFEGLWPQLEQTLKQIRAPEREARQQRTERDLLEETVSLLRAVERKVIAQGFLKRRKDIVPLEKFIENAEGILIIARTASKVARIDLFKKQLENGCRVRFVITHPEAYTRNDIEAVMPMPLADQQALAVFSVELSQTLANIQYLQKLSENMAGKVEARLVNYISNLSFVMVDEGGGRGRIITELMPYKCPMDDRPYIELTSQDPNWYDLFRNTCEEIWKHAAPIPEQGLR